MKYREYSWTMVVWFSYLYPNVRAEGVGNYLPDSCQSVCSLSAFSRGNLSHTLKLHLHEVHYWSFQKEYILSGQSEIRMFIDLLHLRGVA